MTTETFEPTAEQIALRDLIRLLKQTIKDDAVSIRAEKRKLSALASLTQNGNDSAVLQSRLHTQRLQARARLLIYGTLRGKTRSQMEQKHAEKTYNLRYHIAQIWNTLGTTVVMPEVLKGIE